MSIPLKQIVRQRCQHMRKNMPSQDQEASSERVSTSICALDAYQQAQHIALYRAVNGEIDLQALWQSATQHHKICYFPVTRDDLTLLFLPATPTTPFGTGRFGMLEPKVDHTLGIDAAALDILVLPVIAFDTNGTRIGMGSGCYDRSLTGRTLPLLIGAAYEFQRQAYIPPDAWDVPLDAIITPYHTYWSIP